MTRCGDDVWGGPYTPRSAGSAARARVEIDAVAVPRGHTYGVVVKPGTGEVPRSGPAGVPYAWAPLGGALLTAAFLAL
ncbi:hypothetical protein ABZ858_03865 [Streptomyces sp. NPDC047017]|uniref:hypothetical protein n=1 Tax=Streptomyces sp. NPDC047017 TaxID=3155024 RepID=UPI0033F9A4A4